MRHRRERMEILKHIKIKQRQAAASRSPEGSYINIENCSQRVENETDATLLSEGSGLENIKIISQETTGLWEQ